MNAEKLEKLKKMTSSVRTGGKGSVRRKKVVRRGPQASASDVQLNSALKKIMMNQLNADEVKMFTNSGNVIVVNKANVSANIQANTVVVRGKTTERAVGAEDMMDMMDQNSMKQLLEAMRAKGGMPAGAADDVPELVGDFEQAAEVNADAEAKN